MSTTNQANNTAANSDAAGGKKRARAVSSEVYDQAATAVAITHVDKKAKVGGRKANSKNFVSEEVDELLDHIEQVKPWSANHWTSVATLMHAAAEDAGWPKREADSYKTKYNKLQTSKKPTGDPSCPPSVKRAKRVARAIEASIQAACFDDEEGDGDYEEEASSSSSSGGGGSSSSSSSSSSSGSGSSSSSSSGGSPAAPEAAKKAIPPAADFRSNSAKQRAKVVDVLDKIVSALATAPAPAPAPQPQDDDKLTGDVKQLLADMAEVKALNARLAAFLDARLPTAAGGANVQAAESHQ